MSKELYKRFRPKTLKAVIGQDAAISSLERMMSKGLPHSILLTGPSGCGKTTIGRIIKEQLQCDDADYTEVNSADFKGIDMIRDIRRYANLRPMHGPCRMWLIDEAHKLTSDAQNAFLKLLEDTPAHAYFLLATTDPQKLIPTIHTRCSEIKLKSLALKDLERVLRRVIDKEGMKVPEDVVSEIISVCDGSARKALVILEQVGFLDGEDAQLAAIQTTTFNKDAAIDLARAFFPYKGQTTWPEVAKTLRTLSDQDVEGIRYCVLGYARSVLIGKENKGPNLKFAEQAFKVIDIFSRNMYDSKHAGLAAACWEVLYTK